PARSRADQVPPPIVPRASAASALNLEKAASSASEPLARMAAASAGVSFTEGSPKALRGRVGVGHRVVVDRARVVPAPVLCPDPVGLGRAPAPPGVGVDRARVIQQGLDDLPGGLDGVLPCEADGIALDGVADEA